MNIEINTYLPMWLLATLAVLLVVRLYINVWRDFLAIFHLVQVEDARPGLPPVSRWLGYRVLLPVGLFRDWALNWMLSVPFLDLPHHPLELVTGRLQRYVWAQEPELNADAPRWLQLLWPARMGWWHVHAAWWQLLPYRRRIALAVDRDQIEPYDPGHIKKGP